MMTKKTDERPSRADELICDVCQDRPCRYGQTAGNNRTTRGNCLVRKREK